MTENTKNMIKLLLGNILIQYIAIILSKNIISYNEELILYSIYVFFILYNLINNSRIFWMNRIRINNMKYCIYGTISRI